MLSWRTPGGDRLSIKERRYIQTENVLFEIPENRMCILSEKKIQMIIINSDFNLVKNTQIKVIRNHTKVEVSFILIMRFGILIVIKNIII